MNIFEMPTAMARFFEKTIMPHIPNSGERWGAYFAILAYTPVAAQKISDNISVIRECGIIDQNNIVDIEKLEKYGTETFSKVPEVKLGTLGFTIDEFKGFISFIKSSGDCK
jgi:hypothetical protein